jgi:hypothetical protein
MHFHSNSSRASCSDRTFACALSVFAFGVTLLATSAHAAPNSRYQEARQACLSGQTYESKEVCLKEAAAAAGEAKKGNLTDTPDRYRQNALARCNVLPQADRDACARRVEGDGTTSGSVEGGGIYRETRTIVTEPSPGTTPPAGNSDMPAPPPPSGSMPSRY